MGCCESTASELNELSVATQVAPTLRTQLSMPTQQLTPSPVGQSRPDVLRYYEAQGIIFEEVTNVQDLMRGDISQSYKYFNKSQMPRRRPHATSVHSSSETSCSMMLQRQ